MNRVVGRSLLHGREHGLASAGGVAAGDRAEAILGHRPFRAPGAGSDVRGPIVAHALEPLPGHDAPTSPSRSCAPSGSSQHPGSPPPPDPYGEQGVCLRLPDLDHEDVRSSLPTLQRHGPPFVAKLLARPDPMTAR